MRHVIRRRKKNLSEGQKGKLGSNLCEMQIWWEGNAKKLKVAKDQGWIQSWVIRPFLLRSNISEDFTTPWLWGRTIFVQNYFLPQVPDKIIFFLLCSTTKVITPKYNLRMNVWSINLEFVSCCVIFDECEICFARVWQICSFMSHNPLDSSSVP